MQTITAKDIRESQGLVDSFSVAQKTHKNDAEVARLENELWELYQSREKAKVLEHQTEVTDLSIALDLKRGRIREIFLAKGAAVEKAQKKIEEFNKSRLKPARKKLHELWVECEKLKKIKVDSVNELLFGGRIYRVRSNILAVLKHQLVISKAFHGIHTLMNLKELSAGLDDASAIPSTLEMLDFKMHEKIYFGLFEGQFPDRNRFEDEKTLDRLFVWEPHAVSTALILNEKIKNGEYQI